MPTTSQARPRATHRSALHAAVLVAVGLLAAACASGSATPTTTAAATSTSTTIALPVPKGQTVWLCRPGATPDPCAGNLSYAVVPPTGATTVVAARPATSPSIACFYVYPTTSEEPTANSDLKIQATEIGVAHEQVAPLSQDCGVYAPMYRQMTVTCLFKLQVASSMAGCSDKDPAGVEHTLNVAYASLVNGFAAFLRAVPAHEPFVLMGHSQGAAMLIRLIKNVVDPDPALRDRLVSAILLGGNLTVPKGGLVGGAFKHIPLCTSASELHCAIAYSSFLHQPPTTTFFGVPGSGVSFMWLDDTKAPALQVACVAPNQLLGQTWTEPRFYGGPHGRPYVTYPDLYQARCSSSDGATVLHVSVAKPTAGGNPRPVVTESLGPNWGLHLWDPNMTLGDLVTIVGREAAAAGSSTGS